MLLFFLSLFKFKSAISFSLLMLAAFHLSFKFALFLL